MSKRYWIAGVCALVSLSALSALLAAKPNSAPTGPNSATAKAAATVAAKPTATTTTAPQAASKSLSDSARLDTYVKADGTGYFALSLSPTQSLPAADSGEIVVLFDTSASQLGIFRERGLAALRAFAAECKPSDRLQLVAVDLTSVPLTESFVAADSQAWQDAVLALQSRVPLGATDLPLALRSALARFSAGSAAAKSIVYFGDGVSAANVIVPEQFVALCEESVGVQVPVSGYAVGPRCDGPLLASLANHTGGMLVIDGERIAPKEAGVFLGRSAHEQVLWPTSASWPKVFTAIYPQTTPPLRTDRDTVLIGTGKISGSVEVSLSGTAAGKTIEQNWTVAAGRSNDDYSYLTVLVDGAAKNGGTALPILGTAGLQEIGRMVASDAEGLARLSGQAVSTGNLENAERLNAEALRHDPNDPNALAVKKQLDKLKAGEAAPAAEEKPAVEQNNAKPKNSPAAAKSGAGKPAAAKPAAAKPATGNPAAAAPAEKKAAGVFAVADDLKLGPSKKKTADTSSGNAAPAPKAAPAQSQATSKAPKTPARPPKFIDLKLVKGQDSRPAWNKYFAEHPETSDKPEEVELQRADVRETVRQLNDHRQWDQVSALIQAALLNGQVQPWMYEALSLAQQISGAPKSDLERTLMSAADFSENIDELMFLAQAMAKRGLDERALAIFRQAGARPDSAGAVHARPPVGPTAERPRRHPMVRAGHPQPGLAARQSRRRKERHTGRQGRLLPTAGGEAHQGSRRLQGQARQGPDSRRPRRGQLDRRRRRRRVRRRALGHDLLVPQSAVDLGWHHGRRHRLQRRLAPGRHLERNVRLPAGLQRHL